LGCHESTRIVRALRFGLAQLPWTELRAGSTPPSIAEVLDHVQLELYHAIDALRRPIDAIKHQAKTVTVGISREAHAIRPPAGVLIRAAIACGVSELAISDAEAAAFASLEPVVDACLGVVHYRLENLSPLGAPTEESQIVVTAKTGVAEGLTSRADSGAPLRGTKRGIVRVPRLWVGHGQRDGRSLVLCPLYAEGRVAGLSLFHVQFKSDCDTKTRVSALRAVGRYEDLKCAITEWDTAWDDALLDSIPIETLLTAPVERLAEGIQGSDKPLAESL
jgi:glucosamine--fructose-6-phosphate aminotransferase (isomerizing)